MLIFTYIYIMIVTYKGRGISTNEAYSGGFRNRHGKSVLLKTQFRHLLSPLTDNYFERYEIIVRYNGRFDLDNTVATVKIFIDSMREVGIVKDDTKHFFKKLTLIYEPEQDTPSYVFEVVESK